MSGAPVAEAQFVRVKRIKKQKVSHRVVAAHNLREIKYPCGVADHINNSLTKLNMIIAGPSRAVEVEELAQKLLDDANLKSLRKDAVIALEIVFSLPPTTAIDIVKYFNDCVAWVQLFYPIPLLSAVIHRDESAPHCHVVMLPLVNGRMNGSRLFGNKFKLNKLQIDFHLNVGQKYGLVKKSKPKRLSIARRRVSAALAIEEIKRNPNSLNNTDLTEALITSISVSPEPVLKALGLPIPEAYPVWASNNDYKQC